MAAITVQGLTKRFGDVLAVDQLDFAIDEGTWPASSAPTGPARPPPCGCSWGWSPPTPAPPPSAAGLAPGRVEEVLSQTGLAGAARRRVGGFSLGMRQRLGLAAALLGDPEVLVLDEPANGLDPEGVHWLRGLVRGLANQGRTVLVSSHLLAEVAQTVDQVVIIDKGRLVAQSTLAALTAGADQTVRVRTPDPEALRDLLLARGATVTVDGPDRLVVGGVTTEQVGQAAAAGGVVLHDMRFERSNLEDVFLELTGGKGDPR
jgi:ABC-2 type transport system ATP-binding protein